MFRNSKGFTIIEFLIATLILMVGLLGMLQGVNIAMEKSLDTVFRNEAVSLADSMMMEQRSRAFADINTEAKIGYSRIIKGIQKSYSASVDVTAIQNSKQINIEVTWKYRNANKSHQVSSAVSQLVQN